MKETEYIIHINFNVKTKLSIFNFLASQNTDDGDNESSEKNESSESSDEHKLSNPSVKLKKEVVALLPDLSAAA